MFPMFVQRQVQDFLIGAADMGVGVWFVVHIGIFSGGTNSWSSKLKSI